TTQVANDRRRDGAADLILEREHVLNFAVVGIRPDVLAGGCIDKLRCDANTIAHSAYAAFDQIARTEFETHLLQVEDAASIPNAGVGRDHGERAPGRETCDQVFGEAIGEKGLRRVGREVVERQYGDRWSASEGGDREPSVRSD